MEHEYQVVKCSGDIFLQITQKFCYLFSEVYMLQSGMRVLSFEHENAEGIFAEALTVLKRGGIVAYPTESFYALGVLTTDEEALKKLFALKERPADKPLPVIVGDMDTLMTIVRDVSGQAGDVMKRYWPGPLTLILQANDKVPPLLTAGTGRVAVRIPGASAALDLAKALKMPITATSANPSGRAPAETAEEVISYFKDKVDLIINAGKTPGGRPSTIADVTVTPPRILREGRIAMHGL
jgi:L-threonylcarbamoyladenylate synthase